MIRRDFGDVTGAAAASSNEDWMRRMGIAWTVPGSTMIESWLARPKSNTVTDLSFQPMAGALLGAAGPVAVPLAEKKEPSSSTWIFALAATIGIFYLARRSR